jgi:hypothetical protein
VRDGGDRPGGAAGGKCSQESGGRRTGDDCATDRNEEHDEGSTEYQPEAVIDAVRDADRECKNEDGQGNPNAEAECSARRAALSHMTRWKQCDEAQQTELGEHERGSPARRVANNGADGNADETTGKRRDPSDEQGFDRRGGPDRESSGTNVFPGPGLQQSVGLR